MEIQPKLQGVSRDVFISKVNSVCVGLYYEMPVLFIKSDINNFVYITQLDWDIMCKMLTDFEKIMEGQKSVNYEYCNTIAFAYNTIAIMEDDNAIKVVNTCLNDGKVILREGDIKGLKRAKTFINRHLLNLMQGKELYVGTRKWRKNVLEKISQ